MKKLHLILVVATTAALVLSACGAGGGDLLTDIKSRGYMMVSTNKDYAPQSFLNSSGQRTAGSKCPGSALTTGEMQGFDVDVAAELGKRLGVETCFVTPDWSAVTVGNWSGQWDINVGSMSITPDRQNVLAFTSAYFYQAAALAVTKESGITSLDQLSGKSLCVPASLNYADWLSGKLNLPADDIYAKPPAGITVVAKSNELDCSQALRANSKDFVGYIASQAVIQRNIADGLPVVQLGGPIFVENFAVAADKESSMDVGNLVSTLDGFVKAMHTDGTLTTLSNKWFQTDLTQAPTR